MCPHATTTTVAFLYGGDLAHAAHVAQCDDCQRVVWEHEAVTSALAPALHRLRPARSAATRRWAVVVALAAAAALAVWAAPGWRGASDATARPMDASDLAMDQLEIELAALESEEP